MEKILPSKKEKWICVLSALPLFFSWLIGLSFFSSSTQVKNQSIKSAIVSFIFLTFMLIVWVLTRLPLIGFYIRYAAPFLGGFFALFYIFISLAFVIAILKNKPLEIGFINTQLKKLI